MSNVGAKRESNAGKGVSPCSSSPVSVNSLNYDCLAKIFKYLPLLQRLEMERASFMGYKKDFLMNSPKPVCFQDICKIICRKCPCTNFAISLGCRDVHQILVSKFCLVCKHWKEASHYAWNDRTIVNFSMSVNISESQYPNELGKLPLNFRTIKGIGTVLKRFNTYGHLEKLIIGEPCECSIMPIVAQHLPNLKKLWLKFISYDVNCMQVLSNMEKLKSLQISFLLDRRNDYLGNLPPNLINLSIYITERNNPYDVPPEGTLRVTNAFRNLSQLEYFEVYHCLLDRTMIHAIVEKTGLTSLDLVGCFINTDLRPIFRLENLQHLTLEALSPFYEGYIIDDDFIIQLADSFKHLNFLKLSHYPAITDRGIVSLQRLPQLKELILSHVDITDGPLGGMVQLEKISCNFCKRVGNEGIIRLINNAIKLKQLDLHGCGVSEAVIMEALKGRNSLSLKF